MLVGEGATKRGKRDMRCVTSTLHMAKQAIFDKIDGRRGKKLSSQFGEGSSQCLTPT